MFGHLISILDVFMIQSCTILILFILSRENHSIRKYERELAFMKYSILEVRIIRKLGNHDFIAKTLNLKI